MQFKVALALLFASIAVAAPPVTDANLLAREPQGASCCSFVPGRCNCGCCPRGPCATDSDPRATC